MLLAAGDMNFDFDAALLVVLTVMLTELGKDGYRKLKQRVRKMIKK